MSLFSVTQKRRRLRIAWATNCRTDGRSATIPKSACTTSTTSIVSSTLDGTEESLSRLLWYAPLCLSFNSAHALAGLVGLRKKFKWFLYLAEENQIEDPRMEWRSVQEQMLSDYLKSAEDDLLAKQDLLQIKTQRLALAKDHYHQLNRTFSNIYSSKSSGWLSFIFPVTFSL